MRRVDLNFAAKPRSSARPLRVKPDLVQNTPRRLQHPPVRSLDGIQQPRPKATAQPRTQTTDTAQPQTIKARNKRKPFKFQTPLLVLAIVAGGFLIQQSAAVGELCIVVYAIIALKQRVASRLTFILALIAFVGVLALLFFQANQSMAVNFALYSFLLLGVAVLSLTRELLGGQPTKTKHR